MTCPPDNAGSGPDAHFPVGFPTPTKASRAFVMVPESVAFSRASDQSVRLWMLIRSLSDKTGYCWASDGYLADRTTRSRRSVQRSIKELTGLGFLSNDYKPTLTNSVRRKLTPLPSPRERRCDKDGVPGTTEMADRVRQKCHTPGTTKMAYTLTPSGTTQKPIDINRLDGGGAHHPQDGCQKNPSKSCGDPNLEAHLEVSKFLGSWRLVAKEIATSLTEGIPKGSPKWLSLYPPDGSATYKPNDLDIAKLLPAVEAARLNGIDFFAAAAKVSRGWITLQVSQAIDGGERIRDCLRMSAFADYLSSLDAFRVGAEAAPRNNDLI